METGGGVGEGGRGRNVSIEPGTVREKRHDGLKRALAYEKR